MELKVDKLRKEATVVLEDGEELKGNFFVSPVSSFRSGPELLSELLMGEAYFLPFETEKGQMVFLQRHFIRYVALKDKEAEEEAPHLKRETVDVCLLSGEILKGDVLVDLPKSRSRLSDFFNACGGFFYLLTARGQHLVNSRSVKLVRPALG